MIEWSLETSLKKELSVDTENQSKSNGQILVVDDSKIVRNQWLHSGELKNKKKNKTTAEGL